MPPRSVWFSYAVIRVVPRVERGEFLNVGVILFARTARFLAARIELDRPRLHAFAPDLDVTRIERHLDAFITICAGRAEGGPIAQLPPSERFHWLTAPRSAVIQTSPVHIGCDTDPRAALDALCTALVRPPLDNQRGEDRDD
ncbi:MAG: DUF3037 domain-containing protein [Thermomicrobia bacterium]|nr:DUF3037 domain-containing protein [Thermomicrobia bacterium]